MSAHFALAEFLASDTARAKAIDNFPTWDNVANLQRLADTMEQVRTLLHDWPVQISSGFRCPALNSAVGGATNSAHLDGLACDFTVPGYGTELAVCTALQPHLVQLDIDQLIRETGWVHLGLSAGPARHQCLTIDSTGTRPGFV